MGCCCSCNLFSSTEAEDIKLFREFDSLDETINQKNTNTNKTEFELNLDTYKTCCGIKAENQLKAYTWYNIISWLFVCGLILAGGIVRSTTLNQDKYIKYCCQCYEYAQNEMDSGGHVKVDFSYCMDNGCTCDFCADNEDWMGTCGKSVRRKPNDCNDVKDVLSVSSMIVFPKKYWAFYGLVPFLTGALYVAFMCVSFKFKLPEHVLRFMGISMLVYNLILSLNVWWAVFKIFQYYENTFKYSNNEITCFKDGVNKIEEDWLKYTVYATLIVIAVQIFVTLIKIAQKCCCFCTNCCGPNVDSAWNIFTRKLEVFILFITILATVAFLVDLIYVTFKMIGRRLKSMDPNNTTWNQYYGIPIIIIVVDLIILFKSIDIFLVPLFREELFGPGISLFLDRICRVSQENNGDITSYDKMPSIHDDNNLK